VKSRSWIAVATLAALLSASLPAAADEASTHFQRGVELYSEADYRSALNEFRRAYELDPRYQVLYNIAEANFQLQDYANALRTFQKYLNEGGAKITPARRAEVEKELDKLKKRVARLDVVTSEPGATIAIDDVAVGTTPFEEALLVSAGRRKVTATKPGSQPVIQVVELAGGDTRTVKISLSAVATRVEVVMPADTQSSGPRVPIVPWVVTGGFAIGATITGILALGASSDLKTKINTFPGNADEISSARSKTAALAAVTDVLLASTVVAGGLSAYQTYARFKAPPPQAGAAPAAQLVVGPGSAAITGSF
jgi:hypothetical protein